MKRLFSSGFFGLTLLCFFLPWVSVSCQQQKIMTVTGVQMVSGMEIAEPGSGMFGGPAKMKMVEPNTMAIVALIAAVAALFISLIGSGISILPAIVGIATAIALKINIDQDILKQGQGVLLVNYEAGFIGYMFLMAGGAISSLIPNNSPPVISSTDTGVYETKKCPMCAEIIKKDAVICKHCATNLNVDASSVVASVAPCSVPPIATSLLVRDKPAEALSKPSNVVEKMANDGDCPKCGTNIVAGSIFCCECGHRICVEV